MKKRKKKLPEELLTEKEVKRVIDTATHPKDKVIIALLYDGGLRAGKPKSQRDRLIYLLDNAKKQREGMDKNFVRRAIEGVQTERRPVRADSE